MEQLRRHKLAFLAGFAVALVGGLGGHRYLTRAEPAFIVEADEQLRDALRALPPAAAPARPAPSRVALWASPTLRRAELEKALLSSREARGVR